MIELEPAKDIQCTGSEMYDFLQNASPLPGNANAPHSETWSTQQVLNSTRSCNMHYRSLKLKSMVFALEQPTVWNEGLHITYIKTSITEITKQDELWTQSISSYHWLFFHMRKYDMNARKSWNDRPSSLTALRLKEQSHLPTVHPLLSPATP